MIAKIRGHGETKQYEIDGREVSEAEFWASVPTRESRGGLAGEGGQTCGSSLVGFKPIHSESLGVHPRQVKAAQEDAVKKGVPTEFDKKGRPIFTSRLHRKRYCEAYGAFDRDAGYGDATKGSYKGDRPDEVAPETLYGIPQEANHGQSERGDVYEAIRAVKRRHGL